MYTAEAFCFNQGSHHYDGNRWYYHHSDGSSVYTKYAPRTGSIKIDLDGSPFFRGDVTVARENPEFSALFADKQW